MGGKDLLNTPGFLPLVITLVAAPMAIIAILVFAPKQTAAQANTNKYAKINKAHRRFTNNFFTRRDYRRLVEMLSRLSLYNFQEVRYRAVKYYRMSLVTMFGIWFIGTLIFKDFTCSLLLLLFSYLVKNKYIDKNVEKSRRQLLSQFSTTPSVFPVTSLSRTQLEHPVYYRCAR